MRKSPTYPRHIDLQSLGVRRRRRPAYSSRKWPVHSFTNHRHIRRLTACIYLSDETTISLKCCRLARFSVKTIRGGDITSVGPIEIRSAQVIYLASLRKAQWKVSRCSHFIEAALSKWRSHCIAPYWRCYSPSKSPVGSSTVSGQRTEMSYGIGPMSKACC